LLKIKNLTSYQQDLFCNYIPLVKPQKATNSLANWWLLLFINKHRVNKAKMVDMPFYRLATYTGLKMRKVREIGKIILDLRAIKTP
jgi:hypothetical protein